MRRTTRAPSEDVDRASLARQNTRRVRALLDARLKAYRRACKDFRRPRSAEDAKERLWDSYDYEIPCSIYLILLALRWCTERNPERDWDREFAVNTAVCILTVSERPSPRKPDEKALDSLNEVFRMCGLPDFEKWPNADRFLKEHNQLCRKMGLKEFDKLTNEAVGQFDEVCRRSSLESFAAWPVEDCIAVYEWLAWLTAYRLTFTSRREIRKAMTYWRKRARRSSPASLRDRRVS